MSSCSFVPEEELTAPKDGDIPDIILENASYTVSLPDGLPLTVHSPQIGLYSTSQNIHIDSPEFTHQKSSGHNVTGSSHTGSYERNKNLLVLEGDVSLHDEDLELNIQANELSWMVDIQQLVSNQPVRIEFGSGNTITGATFTGSLENGRFELTHAKGWIVP